MAFLLLPAPLLFQALLHAVADISAAAEGVLSVAGSPAVLCVAGVLFKIKNQNQNHLFPSTDTIHISYLFSGKNSLYRTQNRDKLTIYKQYFLSLVTDEMRWIFEL